MPEEHDSHTVQDQVDALDRFFWTLWKLTGVLVIGMVILVTLSKVGVL